MFPNLDLSQLPSLPLTQSNQLPQHSAIYFAINAEFQVLYIGKALNLQARWKGHHRLDQLMRIHKKSPVRLAWLDCRVILTQLEAMENHYISIYNPLLNRTQVPAKKITPSEVSLQVTLEKISKYVIIFGIKPGTDGIPVVILKYLGWGREVNAMRRIFQANNRKPTGLRWTEFIRRKTAPWWRTSCNGVRLELGPWGLFQPDTLRSVAVRRHLAGVEILALQQITLDSLIQEFSYLAENNPGLTIFENDPVPLIWMKGC
jgi:predicted GIY-YIG superfamily endonuclease